MDSLPGSCCLLFCEFAVFVPGKPLSSETKLENNFVAELGIVNDGSALMNSSSSRLPPRRGVLVKDKGLTNRSLTGDKTDDEDWSGTVSRA